MVTSSNEKYTVGSIYQVCMCLALMNELYTEVSHQKKVDVLSRNQPFIHKAHCDFSGRHSLTLSVTILILRT